MDMADQPQLWTPAVESIAVSCFYVWPHGWSARVSVRRSGRAWGDEPQASYEGLSTSELYDVLTADLDQLLGR